MSVRRVVVDTNVVVSALTAGGTPQKILKAWIAGVFLSVMSDELRGRLAVIDLAQQLGCVSPDFPMVARQKGRHLWTSSARVSAQDLRKRYLQTAFLTLLVDFRRGLDESIVILTPRAPMTTRRVFAEGFPFSANIL